MAKKAASIGARTDLARKAKGLSARSLADAVGLSHTAILKICRGELVPTSGTLVRLAQGLGVTVEYLLRPFSVELQGVEFRRKKKLAKREQNAIQAQVEDQLERLLILEEFLPPDDRPKLDLPHISCPTPQDAESAAEELRRKWRLGFDPIRDLTTLLEDRGIRVFAVTAPEAFDGLSGLADHEACIAVGADWPGDRQRFSLAHELGHLVLELPSDDGNRAESTCYRFAGAFLIPAPTLRAELGTKRVHLNVLELRDMKREYGISIQALIVRARDVAIISERQYKSWWPRLSYLGWRKKEPEQLPKERPHWRDRLLQRLLAEDLISASRAAEAAGLPLAEIRRMGGDIESAAH